MPKPIGLVFTALAIVLGGGTPALSQPLQFPASPQSALEASQGVDRRSELIVSYNACGRELDYATYRTEMADANYDHEGENLLSILIAKTAWLTDPRFSNLPCDHAMEIARPRRPDGEPEHATVEDFVKAVLQPWNQVNGPAACSFDTSQINATEESVRVRFHVEPECLRRQVNEAVRSMEKDSQMGTHGLVCLEAGPIPGQVNPKGDFDVVVRDAVRLLYMGTAGRRPVLEQATVEHMWEHLLAARGPLSDGEYSLVAGCDDPAGDELGLPDDYADRERWYNEAISSIGDGFKWLWDFFAKLGAGIVSSTIGLVGAPFFLMAGVDPTEIIAPHYDIVVGETENHRLMIEASKFLINDALIRELERSGHDEVDEVREYQSEVRAWLLETLRRLAIFDFDEYNARPYTRYSLNAILNLHDFSRDPAIRTASQIALDRSAAKFAAAQSAGRRLVPYRRLSEHDGKGMFEFIEGADHEVARAVVLTGQTHLLGDRLERGAGSNLIYAAVSPYRLPEAVQQIAMNRDRPFAQDIRHGGLEGFFAARAFTMTVGGIRTPAVLDLYGIENANDRGVARPTAILPALGGNTVDEVYHFSGRGNADARNDNLCGWKGFICGVAPHFPSLFSCGLSGGSSTPAGPALVFVNSAKCRQWGQGPHFYLAAKTIPCTAAICGDGASGVQFGVMDVIDAPNAAADNDPAFDRFRMERTAAFESMQIDATGTGNVSRRRRRPRQVRSHTAGASCPRSRRSGADLQDCRRRDHIGRSRATHDFEPRRDEANRNRFHRRE